MSPPRRLPSIPQARRMASAMEKLDSNSSNTGNSDGDREALLEKIRAAQFADENIRRIEYRISMAPFERFLLRTTAEIWSLDVDSFGSDDDDPELQEYLFNQWDWSYDTQSFLCEAFAESNDEMESREKVYDGVIHILARLPYFHLRRQFRADQLREDNKDFLSSLGNQSFSQVVFVPNAEDEWYWKVLGAMYRESPEEMEFWTNAVTRRIKYGKAPSNWKTWVLQYEIWKVVRMFNLKKSRPDNAKLVVRIIHELP